MPGLVPWIYWDPLHHQWPYPPRKGRAGRKTRKTRSWRLLSSVAGRIDIYLGRSRPEAPKEGAAGWFAKNLSMFTKQKEQYSIKAFLKRYSEFLSDVGLRNVLLAEIDYDEVYVDRDNKDPDDLEDAIAKAHEHVSHSDKGNKIMFSTFGKTNYGLKNDLHFVMEAQYYRKHGQGKPSIEIRVLGIPYVFARQSGEGGRQYKARMKKLFRELRSDVKKETFARKYENTAKLLLRDYERHLKKVFDIAKTTRWLHLAWGATDQDAGSRLKF